MGDPTCVGGVARTLLNSKEGKRQLVSKNVQLVKNMKIQAKNTGASVPVTVKIQTVRR